MPLLSRFACLMLCAFATPLPAATFLVDLGLDVLDADPGDGQCEVGPAVPGPLRCSLRAAVMEAEALPGADTIEIEPGLVIDLTLAGDGGTEIGDLDIGSEIEILGYVGEPPFDSTLLPLIDASALSNRHFHIFDGQVMLRGLRLQGGNPEFDGGAVLVAGNGTLRVEHTQFQFNTASRGGAINASGGAQVTVSDSNFFRNDAGGPGYAAIAAQLNASVTIERSSFLDNRDESIGATLGALSSARLAVVDSTIDGSELRPPIVGLGARRGIAMSGSAELLVRNTTIGNYSQTAVRLTDLDGDERIRIVNSTLQSDATPCVASGTDLAAADVQIAYTLIEQGTACVPFYVEGVRTGVPELAPLMNEPPRLTYSRPPTGPLSNVVDRGWPGNDPPSDPDLRCSINDQRGQPRPLDADLDGTTRCDLGAIEQTPPEPFLVNHFETDQTDNLPGDGECETIPLPSVGAVCTLRAAIMESNALPGLQWIRFEESLSPALLTLPDSGGTGGALEITDALAIEGNLDAGRPATAVFGQMPDERLFVVQASSEQVYLRNLRLSGGDATGAVGGALMVASGEVSLARSALHDNSADAGGGAVAVIGGSLSIHDTDFHSNQTTNAGSALFTNGGGFSVIRSSFREHFGIRPDGSPIPVIQMLPGSRGFLFDSTFSNNQAGIEAQNPDLLQIVQLTLHEQLQGAFRINLAAASELYLFNTIAAASSSPVIDCLINGTGLATTVAIDNLIDSDGSCAGLAVNGWTDDPLLEALSRPAGQVSYLHRPAFDTTIQSPVLDRAANDSCTGLHDQTGRARPVDLPGVENTFGGCDLGAVELAPDRLFSDRFD
jgi:hypothetical protein